MVNSNQPLQSETIALLTAILRDSSLSRLKSLSRREKVRLVELPIEPIVYDHFMAMILISGKPVKITFKMHFNSDAGRFFASIPYNRSPNLISESAALGFFNELANFIAGQVKEVLSDNSAQVSVSLPVLARGFDEVFYTRSPGTVIKFWRLICESHQVGISAHIELLEKFSLNKIRLDDAIDSGEVDFL